MPSSSGAAGLEIVQIRHPPNARLQVVVVIISIKYCYWNSFRHSSRQMLGYPEFSTKRSASQDLEQGLGGQWKGGMMMRLETLIELKFVQFELLELILVLTLDKQFPVEQVEATVSQSAVPSPPLSQATLDLRYRAGRGSPESQSNLEIRRGLGSESRRSIVYAYIYIYIQYMCIYIYITYIYI